MDPRFAKPTAVSRALMVGREDVDLDIVMIAPAKAMLRSEKKTRASNAGWDQNRTMKCPMTATQIGLIADAYADGPGLAVLLYPRMTSALTPTVTPIADGKGVKVQQNGGTDYVFVSPQPITVSEGTLSFAGTVGLVQLRAGKATLSLGAAGKIAYGSDRLER